jgi:hypothetical protein
MTPAEDLPADLQDALAAALARVREQLGDEGFEREMKRARARHARAQRPRPAKNATALEAPDLLPQLKRRLADQEKRVAVILARRQAVAQTRQLLADIATARNNLKAPR